MASHPAATAGDRAQCTPPMLQAGRLLALWMQGQAGGPQIAPEVAWVARQVTREEQLRWLLLRLALDQGAPAAWLEPLLSGLQQKWGAQLSALPAPREAELQELLRSRPGHEKWMLADRFVGIVLSWGEFLRRRGPLEGWLQGGLHLCLEQSSREILHFGRWSVERHKARMFLTLACAPTPTGLAAGGCIVAAGGTGPASTAELRAVEWGSWVFPLEEGHLRFWRAHRELLAQQARSSRPEVAQRLSACYRCVPGLEPVEAWSALRGYDAGAAA